MALSYSPYLTFVCRLIARSYAIAPETMTYRSPNTLRGAWAQASARTTQSADCLADDDARIIRPFECITERCQWLEVALVTCLYNVRVQLVHLECGHSPKSNPLLTCSLNAP